MIRDVSVPILIHGGVGKRLHALAVLHAHSSAGSRSWDRTFVLVSAADEFGCVEKDEFMVPDCPAIASLGRVVWPRLIDAEAAGQLSARLGVGQHT